MADPAPQSPSSPPQGQAPVQIGIGVQYVRDFSFENPNAPQIFAPSDKPPAIDIGVNLRTRPLADNGTHEVLLMLHLQAKIEDKVAFISELAYGGVFMLPPQLSEEQTKLLLLIECPRLLFPFARALLIDAVRNGGFPQIIINPIDFGALYRANKDNIGTTAPAKP